MQPLGSQVANPSLLDDASKDDEERRLESMLFGKKYVPVPQHDADILVVSDGEGEDADVGQELQNMMDTDVRIKLLSAFSLIPMHKQLFFVDDANTAPSAEQAAPDFDANSEGGADDDSEGASTSGQSDQEDEADGKDGEDEEGESEAEEIQEPMPVASSSKARKAPAWEDADDTNLTVSLAQNTRLRKLRDAPSDDVVGGREYERRLRRQFERINPTPDWATKARSKLHPSKQKRRRSSVSSEEAAEEEEQDDLSELLADAGGVLGRRSKKLAPGTLSIERLRDANLAAPSEGAIKAVQFHPSSQIPVLLTASEDRRLRFFNVSTKAHFPLMNALTTEIRLTDIQTHICKPYTYQICP